MLKDLEKALSETEIAKRDQPVVPRKLWDADTSAIRISNQVAGVVATTRRRCGRRREVLITVLDAAQWKSVDQLAEIVDGEGIGVNLVAQLALTASALKE